MYGCRNARCRNRLPLTLERYNDLRTVAGYLGPRLPGSQSADPGRRLRIAAMKLILTIGPGRQAGLVPQDSSACQIQMGRPCFHRVPLLWCIPAASGSQPRHGLRPGLLTFRSDHHQSPQFFHCLRRSLETGPPADPCIATQHTRSLDLGQDVHGQTHAGAGGIWSICWPRDRTRRNLSTNTPTSPPYRP